MPVITKRDATSLRSVPRSASLTDPEPDPSVEARHEKPTDVGQPTDVESPPSTGSYASMNALANFMAPMRPSGSLGTREEIQQELDGIALAVRAFVVKQPDQVMREVAAYSARLTELAVLLHRSEDYSREYTRVRTMQVQKWQEQLELQFKIASRLVEVQRQDLELLK